MVQKLSALMIAMIAIAVMALVILYLLVFPSARGGWTRVADPPGILREIKQLNELVTVRYTIQKVTGLREDKIPVGSESILLIVQAKVLGGIDVATMSDADVRLLPGKRVMVRLPPPKILHVYVDEKNTKVWDRTKTWWTPWVPYSLDLEQKARLAALESVEKEAIEMGILRESKQNAESMIRSMLKALGFDAVIFGMAT